MRPRHRTDREPPTSKTPDVPEFPAEQCDALFAAVLAHDDIYPDAGLPDVIPLDYSQQQIIRCYRICRQIWKAVDRSALDGLIKTIYRQRALGPEDQLLFKHVRAKFKHLRFAYATFDERHRYPRAFHWLTAAMGYLQDALKNEQHAATGRLAIRTRLFLTRPFYALATREIDGFRPGTATTFGNYVRNEIGFIRMNLAREKITSRDFHEIRKAVSRQVALYDNLKILYPSPCHCSISRYLSTINGMMGAMHDELIAGKLKKTRDYYADTFEIPGEIKQRLIAFTERYR